MTTDIIIVLSLLVIGIILFSTGRISVDIVTLGLLVGLIIFKILSPAEAFAGFGNDFVIILASVFVISGGLRQTGILDQVGSRLISRASIDYRFLVFSVMLTVGTVSAFMSNTTVTAIFIAPVITLARKLNTNSSRLLMPVAYAAMMGGTCTLIGTSTNIATSAYLERKGLPPLGMFEFLPVGLAIFLTSAFYMAIFGKRLLPDHKNETLTEGFGLREYVSEIVISKKSPLIGQQIFNSNLTKMGFRILNMIRDEKIFMPDDSIVIQEGDILIVEGRLADLLRVKETTGIEIRADILPDQALQGENIKLAEVLVMPQSDFVNTSLKKANFRLKYGLVVIAIKRSGQTLKNKLGGITLLIGDILLVQGSTEKINYFKSSREITILEDFKPLLYKKRKGIQTLVIFILSIIAGSIGLVPLSVAFLIAAILIVSTGALSMEKAYEEINMKLLVLVGGMAIFATAMTKTGTASYLSQFILHYCEPFGPVFVLAGFILLTVLLTQPMSNAAAALLILPIALEAAEHMHVNPRSFAIAVMLSASISLLTPFEPSCVLVYGPGKYKFTDFFKTGFFLTLILMVILVLMIPHYWPL